MRVLFVTSTRVGDAVLSTGLLDSVVRRHPDARVTVVCGPAAEGVFARLPQREATIVLEKRPGQRHWLGLWPRVAFRRWDWVIDLRGSALGWLVPTRRRSIMRSARGGMTRHKTAELADVLRVTPPPLPVVWTDAADRALAARLIPPGRPVVALGPTANWDGKIWPPERFAALFEALAGGDLAGAVPAVFAGPGAAERARATPLLDALPGPIDLAGQLSLPEAAACLQRCALFVGNDSGLMHLAAAAGTATLGLFGPTPMDVYAPAGPRAAAVRGAAGTMASLSVETALAGATALLRRDRPRAA